MQVLELDYFRCPFAMTRARKFLERFVASEHDTAEIKTIEPALFSHIQAFVNDKGYSVTVDEVETESLDSLMVEKWRNTESWDEDDLENVLGIHTISIIKKGNF
ncbi:hypothetical protein NMS01_003660 [Vibrio cholerae]|nr:hypothetical protein [Vibrio cholerae]